MTFQPRSAEDVYDSIRSSITERINKLTNFVDGSFNSEFLRSYSEEIRDTEIKALAAELAGYVDYAGKQITQNDLDRLGIDDVDPGELNEYMEESQLDLLAANFGISRDPGARASTEVTFEISDSNIEIEEGFAVGTQPDSNGDFLRFRVDATESGEIDSNSSQVVRPDEGGEQITAQVIANEPGTEYNIPAGSITYIPNPRPGIQSVVNPNASVGGIEEQDQESLRSDTREAIFQSSNGGTSIGIESYIESSTPNDVEVNVDQYTDQSPPFVDVVIVGEEDNDAMLRELIEESRPAGIRHNLVRPSTRGVGVFTHFENNEDEEFITDQIRTYIESIPMGNQFNWSALLQRIITSTTSSDTVLPLVTYLNTVESERHLFDSNVDVYELNDGPLGRITDEQHVKEAAKTKYETTFHGIEEDSVSVRAVVDGQRRDLEEGVDYTVEDTDGDGELDTIDIDSETNITESTSIRIDYKHNQWEFNKIESDGVTYERGNDYGLIDDNGDGWLDSIDWSIGTESPDDGDFFLLFYEPRSSFEGDLISNNRQRFSHDQTRIQTIGE